MPIGFLLALQASGMVVDWLGRDEQIRLGKIGAELEQQGIEQNIQMSRLQSEQESLESMKMLRQNLGTQAAMMAARGTRAGAGTAALFSNESVANFNADERMRKINQMSREAQLKAGKTLSQLHQRTNESNTWKEFTKNALSKIPTSPKAWDEIRKGFSAKAGYGFGLTPIR